MKIVTHRLRLSNALIQLKAKSIQIPDWIISNKLITIQIGMLNCSSMSADTLEPQLSDGVPIHPPLLGGSVKRVGGGQQAAEGNYQYDQPVQLESCFHSSHSISRSGFQRQLVGVLTLHGDLCHYSGRTRFRLASSAGYALQAGASRVACA